MRPITIQMQEDRLSMLIAESFSDDASQHLSGKPTRQLTPWETVQPPDVEQTPETSVAESAETEAAADEAPSTETEVPPLVDPPASIATASPDLLMATAGDLDQTESTEESARIDPAPAPRRPAGGGLFTIPLMCLGIGLVACCVLIPAAEENHRLIYEREKLQRDLNQISHQIDVNDEFLKRIADDPSLSERLAQRQMKMVREGTSVLDLKGDNTNKEMSPYGLLTLPPPTPLPPYQPAGGILTTICCNPHGQLYMTGLALLLIAAGLVMGQSSRTIDEEA